jgi:hypothetical protein
MFSPPLVFGLKILKLNSQQLEIKNPGDLARVAHHFSAILVNQHHITEMSAQT